MLSTPWLTFVLSTRRKHVRNHKRPIDCPDCPPDTYQGSAQNKDHYRHYWSHHPTRAKELGYPKEEDKCPNCDYKGRSDNVKRHIDKNKCKSKK
jgi:hypothetical protein